MAGNDSIQVVKPVTIQKQKVQRKHPKHRLVNVQKTFFEHLKDYFKLAREVNTNKWAREYQSYSKLYTKG